MLEPGWEEEVLLYGGGGRQRTCRVAASTGGGVVGTSETPQGSLRSGRSVKRLRSGLWFVRSGLHSGVAIRRDIILSSAPAARFSGFATLDGATLASPNSWCLLVSALRSDCVERGGDLDDRVHADMANRARAPKSRKVMQDDFWHPSSGGFSFQAGPA